MRAIIVPILEMRKLKSEATESRHPVSPVCQPLKPTLFFMLPPYVEGLRVTLKKSQEQDFPQVRFILKCRMGWLFKGGRPTDVAGMLTSLV